MIALCQEHHHAAEAGVFSKEELRQLKMTAGKHPAATLFPWGKREFLVRLGGCYTGGVRTQIAIANQPLVQLNRSEDGLLLLSLTLSSSDGSVACQVEDNMFAVQPEEVHDLEVNTSATQVRLWLRERQVGLDLSFRRVNTEELSKQLALDWEKSQESTDEALSTLPPDIRAAVMGTRVTQHDQVGAFVLQWAKEHCIDEEGRIPLLDFKRLALIHEGRHVDVKEGIQSGGLSISYSAMFNLGGALNL